jgi:hypothetical protein
MIIKKNEEIRRTNYNIPNVEYEGWSEANSQEVRNKKREREGKEGRKK